jgi:hypothetical protein
LAGTTTCGAKRSVGCAPNNTTVSAGCVVNDEGTPWRSTIEGKTAARGSCGRVSLPVIACRGADNKEEAGSKEDDPEDNDAFAYIIQQ